MEVGLSYLKKENKKLSFGLEKENKEKQRIERLLLKKLKGKAKSTFLALLEDS